MNGTNSEAELLEAVELAKVRRQLAEDDFWLTVAQVKAAGVDDRALASTLGLSRSALYRVLRKKVPARFRQRPSAVRPEADV